MIGGPADEPQDSAHRWAAMSGFHLERTPAGGEIWNASDEQPEARPVVSATDPVPDDQLRRWALVWIGSGIGLTVLVALVGLATDWFSEDFARLLLQLIVTPLLSAFIVVVGYLFAERKRR